MSAPKDFIHNTHQIEEEIDPHAWWLSILAVVSGLVILGCFLYLGAHIVHWVRG